MIELVYLFFVFQIINFDNLIGKSLVIGGFFAWTWLIYLFYICSYGYVLLYLFEKKDTQRMRIRVIAFLLAVILVHIVSILYGARVNTILKESYHYVIPVFIYVVLYRCKYRYNSFWKFFKILVFVNLVISVSFVTGILGLFFNTSYISLLSRSSTLIDGGLGIVSLAVGLYCLFYENDFYGKKDSWFLIISGIIITLSSQSRARLLTAVLVFIAFLFFSAVGRNRNNGKRFSWTSMTLLITAIAIVAFVFVGDSTDGILSQIINRFSIMGSDNSSVFRVYEQETQLSIFSSHPILGGGWGAFENVSVIDTFGVAKPVHNHNMYTTLLGYGGIILGLAYIVWVIGLLKGIKNRFSSNTAEKLNIVLLIAIIVLSIGSAGFGKSSMILAIAIIYINNNHYYFREYSEGWKSLK